MIVAGVTFSGDEVLATIANDIEPDLIKDGIGLMDDGSLAVDTNTPAGEIYVKGFRISPLGAVYGEQDGTVVNVLQGVGATSAGAIAYVLDDSPDAFANGNPVLHTGELTVEAVA